MKNLHFFLAFFLAPGLWSCEDCGVRGEPKAYINLVSAAQTPFRLDTVFALRSNRPFFLRTGAGSASANFYAPLDLNADSTQYVLLINGQRGILTVRYKREFVYRSSTCGYVVDLKDPKLPKNATFTLGDVYHIAYVQNTYSRNFLSYGVETGINLNIRL